MYYLIEPTVRIRVSARDTLPHTPVVPGGCPEFSYYVYTNTLHRHHRSTARLPLLGVVDATFLSPPPSPTCVRTLFSLCHSVSLSLSLSRSKTRPGGPPPPPPPPPHPPPHHIPPHYFLTPPSPHISDEEGPASARCFFPGGPSYTSSSTR
jgi:hypothetical protein